MSRIVRDHQAAISEAGEIICLESRRCDHHESPSDAPLVAPLAIGVDFPALIRAYYGIQSQAADDTPLIFSAAESAGNVAHFGFASGTRRGKGCALRVPGGYILIGIRESS